MNTALLLGIVIVISIFSIATQMIGRNCMQSSNKTDTANYKVLLVGLATNIIIVFIAVVVFYNHMEYHVK